LGAAKGAAFLKAHLYYAANKRLYRRWREGERQVPGIADDYAFVVQGLLDLYEADFDTTWLVWAQELTDQMINTFYDAERGGFYMTAADHDPHLLIRVKEDQDNVEPSASSVAALNLLRLSQLLDQPKYRAIAEKTLRAFGATMSQTPRAMPMMLAALDFALADPKQVVLVGSKNAADTQALFKTLHSHYIPVKITVGVEPNNTTALSLFPSYIAAMTAVGGHATAYVCEHYVCKKPTSDLQEFDRMLLQ
jgi:uncharacterized protein YyaL (SSP411 family)